MVKYYIAIGAALALSASHAWVYHKGQEQERHESNEAVLELKKKHAAEFQAQLDEIRELEANWLAEETRIVFRTRIQREEVIKYVDKNEDIECLDPIGVELFNAIRAGGLPGATTAPSAVDAAVTPPAPPIAGGNSVGDLTE